jgi:Na+/H+ antiporter NhaD/arsenite permease-like protein
MIIPFGLLLAAMALGPVAGRHWWDKHYPKFAYGLGAVTVLYYLLGLHAWEHVLHTAHEYFSFITLIGSLFVVAGGVHVSVKGEATPALNTAFLLVGALLANLLGTTGASMLLIRPWLRLNQRRIKAYHIAFFIFIVSNVGGCLTPVGDPPLFLGYLRGVPFWWVPANCWPMWMVGVGFLLAVFYIRDAVNYPKAPGAPRAHPSDGQEEWRVDGLWNLAFVALILGAVFISRPAFLREALMVAAAAASWFLTGKQIHERNHFTFHPLQEVAILFVGVFATMLPALDWLQSHADRFADAGPGFFYWGTGVLSSLLDNAPTYLSFLSATRGISLESEAFNHRLLAISIGAVFFGANTYIGNGPNFMVKSIAEHQGAPTSGFVGFLLRFTLPYMLPMLVLLWVLFFR